jgi:hypothetical protein
MATTQIDHRPDVHAWFGLSYSNYLVLPRTLLQTMPEEWQRDFVAKLAELEGAFSHVEQADCYKVTPAVEREVGDLTDEELKQIGYSRSDDCDCVAPPCPHDVTYYDDKGNEMEAWMRVMWPLDRDPVPHYNRGRTHVPPMPVK